MNVTAPSVQVLAMREAWLPGDTLLGGTPAMRAAGPLYLPKHESEDDRDYAVRLKQAYLYPGYSNTTANYGGRTFANDPSLTTDLPLAWFDDFDLNGRNWVQVARRAFHDALTHGLTHFLPDTPRRLGRRLTLADEARGIRPFVTPIPSARILGWKYGDDGTGKLRLEQVRYIEPRFRESDSPWIQETQNCVRVLEIGRSDLYDPEGRKISSTEVDLDYIPLRTANISDSDDVMIGRPFLNDLIAANIAHWQSESDQRYITHWSRVPILVATGISDTDAEMVWGPNRLLKLESGADIKYLETSGSPAAVGRADIDALVNIMDKLAMEPLLPRVSGDRSAAEANISEGAATSRLGAAARTLVDTLELVFEDMARLAGRDPTTLNAGTIDIRANFALSGDPNDIQNLVAARQSGNLSRRQFLIEGRRRNFFSDDMDIDAEMRAQEAEAKDAQALAVNNTSNSPAGNAPLISD